MPPLSRLWMPLLVLVTVYSPAATALAVLPEIAASTMDPDVPAAIRRAPDATLLPTTPLIPVKPVFTACPILPD